MTRKCRRRNIFDKIKLFTVLVCAFHKEAKEVSEFVPLYLEMYLELKKMGKKQLVVIKKSIK